MTVQSVTLDLPEELVYQLVQAARAGKRSISDVVRDRLLDNAPVLPLLPSEVERELAAFPALSDDLLWHVATTVLTPAEQSELAELNWQAQAGELSLSQQARQAQLLEQYDRIMVRRAEAIAQLRSRGYDVRTLFAVPPVRPN